MSTSTRNGPVNLLFVGLAWCVCIGGEDDRYIISFWQGLELANAELDSVLTHAPGSPVAVQHTSMATP
jgi:hypothetical protein